MKTIYYNGNILTMEEPPTVPAVLEEDGVIRRTGSMEELLELAPGAELRNLAGKTMLPAFIDAHGHFSSYANAQLQVSLEGAVSFEEIRRRIERFVDETAPPPEGWVIAKGYDHTALEEHRHPTRELLDAASPDRPVLLQHQSGHGGVANSRALALLGITEATPDPAGGAIGRENGRLTGYLEENAFIQAVKQAPMADFPALLKAYATAQRKYLSHGITTVQEGMMVSQMLPLYQMLLESGALTLDVVGYPDMDSMAELCAAFPLSVKQYHRHFKIGGYKIMLDGSPQMKTAWMNAPYRNCGDYRGYSVLSDEAVAAAVERAVGEGFQLLAHCNGDAAVQQYLDAVRRGEASGLDAAAVRPVIIHAQLITRPQLLEAARLGMIPSFFAAHLLHWGDIHLENFGGERASGISPARSALAAGLPFTFHQDTPVIEPDMLETVQCAVTRRTRAGVLLGPEERITPAQAVRAVTLNAAHQYGEEARKGSIRAGKQADFVILDGNPLTVPPECIGDIAVTETIRAGETLYRR